MAVSANRTASAYAAFGHYGETGEGKVVVVGGRATPKKAEPAIGEDLSPVRKLGTLSESGPSGLYLK